MSSIVARDYRILFHYIWCPLIFPPRARVTTIMAARSYDCGGYDMSLPRPRHGMYDKNDIT